MLLLMFLTIQENVSPKLIFFFQRKYFTFPGKNLVKITDFVYQKPNNFFTSRTFLSY